MTKPDKNTRYPNTAQTAADYYQKAILLKQKKHFHEAIEFFQKAIDHNPNNMEYVSEMAVCYLNLNNFTRVTNILGPVYKKNPENPEVIKTYCSALLETGQIEKAKQILESMEDKFNTDLALKVLWLKATGTKFPQS